MKFKQLFIYLTSTLFIGATYAADTFQYANKPIDPLCLYEMSDTKAADLTRCGLSAEPGRKKTGHIKSLEDKNFLGYTYSWAIEPDQEPLSGCYSYYKVLGNVDNTFVIYMLNNSGGTGSFSCLVRIKRAENILTEKPLAGGDRCNGGITDAKLVANQLTYRVNLTAFDFIDLAKLNTKHLSAYKDLDSCAVCCKAQAIISVDLTAEKPQEKLVYVDLSSYPPQADSGSSATYQKCFDKLLAQYYQSGKTHLDPQKLGQFVDEFNNTCV